jgi:hypothetical protein
VKLVQKTCEKSFEPMVGLFSRRAGYIFLKNSEEYWCGFVFNADR